MGISYDSFRYLADLVPPESLPDPDLKNSGEDYNILSLSIRHFITELKNQPKKLSARFLQWWRDKSSEGETSGLLPAIGVFLIMPILLFFTTFVAIYHERDN